jgi:hypothetical protein
MAQQRILFLTRETPSHLDCCECSRNDKKGKPLYCNECDGQDQDDMSYALKKVALPVTLQERFWIHL